MSEEGGQEGLKNRGEAAAMAGDEPTYATRMIGKLREHIESGQLNIGAGGPGSNNAIVNPIRAAAAAAASAAAAADGSITQDPDTTTKAITTTNTKSAALPGVVQNTSTDGTMSPRTAHAQASKAHAEMREKKRIVEEARHKKERDDKLTRYLVLIICIVVIILVILAMAAISRRVIGKWWHGQPDPIENTQPSDKISHVPLFLSNK